MKLTKVMIALCVPLLAGVTTSTVAFAQTSFTHTARTHKETARTNKFQAYQAPADQFQGGPAGAPRALGQESWDPLRPYGAGESGYIGGSPNGV